MPFPPLNFSTLAWDTQAPAYIPEIDYLKLLEEFAKGKEAQPGSEQSKLRGIIEAPALGVFYLKNPPIKEATIEELVNTTREFLSLSSAGQTPYYVSDGQAMGLAPFGLESTEAVINQGLGIKSNKPAGTDQCIKYSYEFQHPDNKWPNQKLKELSEAFLVNVLAQSQEVLKWIVDLYPPEDEQLEPLSRAIDNAIPFTRHLLYTDVSKENTSETKMHQHADVSLVTTSYRMPAANGFKALQYKVNEEFQPTPVVRNTSSMHVGEALAAYYQGAKKMNSPVHFVAMPPQDKRGNGGEHTSLVTFVNPGKNTKVPRLGNSYYRTFHQQEEDSGYAAGVGVATAALTKK